MTHRDLILLRIIKTYDILSADSLSPFFPSYKKAHRRVFYLYQQGYLNRLEIDQRHYYYVSKKGCQIIGAKYKEARYNHHNAQRNNICFAFKNHAAKNNVTCREIIDVNSFVKDIYPDAVICLTLNSKSILLYLENDNQSEPIHRTNPMGTSIQKKMLAIANHFDQKYFLAWEDVFDTQFRSFTSLWISQDDTRQKQLVTTAKETGIDQMTLFSLFQNAVENPYGKTWHSPALGQISLLGENR